MQLIVLFVVVYFALPTSKMGKLATETKPQDGGVGQEAETSKAPVSTSQTLLQKLKQGAELIQQAVKDRDTRAIVGRVLRETNSVKDELNISTLVAFLKEHFPDDHPSLKILMDQLAKYEDSMEVDSNGTAAVAEKTSSVLPEIEVYSFLLTQLLLLSMNEIQAAKKISDVAAERLTVFNRRTLDIIAARIYFYLSLVYEKLDQLAIIRP